MANFGTTIANNKCEEITKHERDWATYCRLLLWNFRFVCVVLVDNNCYSSKFTPIFWGQASVEFHFLFVFKIRSDILFTCGNVTHHACMHFLICISVNSNRLVPTHIHPHTDTDRRRHDLRSTLTRKGN